MKKILKVGLWGISVVVFLGFSGLIFLTLTDYKPPSSEILEIHNNSTMNAVGDSFSILTWNIGYGALGASEDFFLDDGTKIRPGSKDVVLGFMGNITKTLGKYDTDFVMIQEIDINSKRSYFVNELDLVSKALINKGYSYAKNYDVKYVPMPLPPVGRVVAGLSTFSPYEIEEAKRFSFEGNYKWPLKTIMLDRCFSVSRIPIESKEGDLVLINSHFSAYDDGSLRLNQIGFIKDFIIKEFAKGNYVVLGGDWNQTFESIDHSSFPIYRNGDFYMPSVITMDWIDEGWTLAFPKTIPTYRLLDSPYEKGVSQVGIIDGFLVSPNVRVDYVDGIDLGFKDSDHNPVIMNFSLKE